MSALDARRRRPDEEALTHLHRMTDSLRRMVAASRVGRPQKPAALFDWQTALSNGFRR